LPRAAAVEQGIDYFFDDSAAQHARHIGAQVAHVHQPRRVAQAELDLILRSGCGLSRAYLQSQDFFGVCGFSQGCGQLQTQAD
jgi:hypothetical protein